MKKLLLLFLIGSMVFPLGAQTRTKEFKVYGYVFDDQKNPVSGWDVAVTGPSSAYPGGSAKTNKDGFYSIILKVPSDPPIAFQVITRDPCQNAPLAYKFTTENSSFQQDFVICSQSPPNPCRVAFKYSQLRNELIVEFSAYPDIPGAKYSWDFGDGNTAEGNPVKHVYAKAGNYKVSLKVSDPNCKGSYTGEVEVKMTTAPPPPPPPSTSVEARCCAAIQILSQPVTTNAGPNTFKFFAKGDFPVNAVRWDFGDGEFGSGAEVTHTYKTEGKYRVTAYLVGEDCKVELGAWVHAGKNTASPCDQYEVLLKTDGLKVAFGLNSRVTPDKIHWDFGDGSSSNDLSPLHEYAKDGSYLVIVEFVINGQYCRIEKKISVQGRVGNNCPFDFAFRANGLNINFAPIATNTKYDSVEWYFGDGTQSKEEFPAHQYAKAGEYQVVLVVYFGTQACKIAKTVKVSSLTGGGGRVSIIEISPNPVEQEMTVKLKSSEKLSVVLVITDVTGLNLKSKKLELEPGENIVPWNVEDLGPGLYYIQVNLNNEVLAKSRFLKA